MSLNLDTKKPCQGYCGGYVKLRNMRQAPGGEFMCPDCFEKATR